MAAPAILARCLPSPPIGSFLLRLPAAPLRPQVNLLESALAGDHRVLAEISRSCLLTSSLESALTSDTHRNSFRIRTYKKPGGGSHSTEHTNSAPSPCGYFAKPASR